MVSEAILDLFQRMKTPSGTMTRRQRGRDAIPKNVPSQENHVNPWETGFVRNHSGSPSPDILQCGQLGIQGWTSLCQHGGLP